MPTDELEDVVVPPVLGLDLDKQKEDDADPRNFPYESIAVGGALPQSFSIVSVVTNQRQIDSCVGHGVAGSKSDQEKVQISPRDIWGRCKEAQNYQGYGASINTALKFLNDFGSCEYGMVDEDCTVTRDVYMRVTRTDAIVANELLHKSQSFWFIRPEAYEVIKEALMNENIALVTSLPWFNEYNRPVNGYLPIGKTPATGHCVRFSGWFMEKFADGVDEVWVFTNSFGKGYGVEGKFYIRRRDLARYNFGNFYVTVDMSKDLGKLITQYAGKFVKTADDSRVYLIERATKRHVENELAFWLASPANLVSDVLTIPADELAMFSEGTEVKVTDADPTLLRVIKNMAAMYESNPERAKLLFKF